MIEESVAYHDSLTGTKDETNLIIIRYLENILVVNTQKKYKLSLI